MLLIFGLFFWDAFSEDMSNYSMEDWDLSAIREFKDKECVTQRWSPPPPFPTSPSWHEHVSNVRGMAKAEVPHNHQPCGVQA